MEDELKISKEKVRTLEGETSKLRDYIRKQKVAHQKSQGGLRMLKEELERLKEEYRKIKKEEDNIKEYTLSLEAE